MKAELFEQDELMEASDGDLSFFKGCLNGIFLSLPLWAALIGGVKFLLFKS